MAATSWWARSTSSTMVSLRETKRGRGMTLIRIREQLSGQDGSNALLSFEHGAEYPISIHDPFSEEEEQQLEWYFEQWLRFPFLHQVKAQATTGIIPTYGEKLF